MQERLREIPARLTLKILTGNVHIISGMFLIIFQYVEQYPKTIPHEIHEILIVM